MKVSVIIPTYNAEKYLPKLLDALQTQTLKFELIIIDSSSTDNTQTLVSSNADILLTVPQNEFDHGGTRTKAAKMASGDILLFLTQDALPHDNQSLEKLCMSLDHNHIAAAYGRQIPYEHTSYFGKHLRYFNYPSTSHTRSFSDKDTVGIKTGFLSDSFAVYKKEALESVGWFKNGLIVGEDSYAGSKLILEGNSLHYCSEAKVYHSHSYSLIEECKRYFDIGVFHKHEPWILQNFGKAEGEGLKYVQSELTYLLREKAYIYIPMFVVRNTLKYIGYKLGYNYSKFPIKLIRKISMHPLWWNKNFT